MTARTRAVVQTAPRALELRELPLPEIGPDDALLQVEACGICGSDYEQDEGRLPSASKHKDTKKIQESLCAFVRLSVFVVKEA